MTSLLIIAICWLGIGFLGVLFVLNPDKIRRGDILVALIVGIFGPIIWLIYLLEVIFKRRKK